MNTPRINNLKDEDLLDLYDRLASKWALKQEALQKKKQRLLYSAPPQSWSISKKQRLAKPLAAN